MLAYRTDLRTFNCENCGYTSVPDGELGPQVLDYLLMNSDDQVDDHLYRMHDHTVVQYWQCPDCENLFDLPLPVLDSVWRCGKCHTHYYGEDAEHDAVNCCQ